MGGVFSFKDALYKNFIVCKYAKNVLSIFEYLGARGGFEAFLASVKIARLENMMESDSITLFAPRDEAFSKIPANLFDNFLARPDELAEIISSHFVSGKLRSADICALSQVEVLDRKRFTLYHGGLRINGARIIESDIECANGIMHVIDRIIVPPKRIIWLGGIRVGRLELDGRKW